MTITIQGYVNTWNDYGINDWHVGVIGIKNNVRQIRNFIAILKMYNIKFPDNEIKIDNFYDLMQLPAFKHNGFKLGTNVTIYHLWQHCQLGSCYKHDGYGVGTGFRVVSCDKWNSEPMWHLHGHEQWVKCDSSERHHQPADALKTTYIIKLESNRISFYYDDFEHPISLEEYSKELCEKHYNVVSENEMISLPDKEYFYFPIFQTTGNW